MLTDAELLRRYAEDKSDAAFADLVARHVDLVYSAALRQVGGDTHRAQDIVQVVFTTLARKAASLTRHPVLAGWLYTATQHAAAKTIRSEARRRAREQEAHVMQEILSSDGGVTDWQRVRPVLDDAMRELGERDREAVLLRFFAHRPFAEIGAALNVSEDGARMRVERALDKLHALLGRRGVTSTSGALAVALAAQAVSAAPAGLATTVTGTALAGAAAGAGLAGGTAAAAAWLTFMSTGKIAATIVAVGGLAAVGLGVYGLQRSHTAEEALAAVGRERDALQARVRESEARALQAEERARENEARLAALPTAPGARGKPAAAVDPAGGDDPSAALIKAKVAASAAEKQALYNARATNPDMQRLTLQAERASFALRFGPLYSRLNLSPEQVARFEQRLTAASETSLDLMAASVAKGLSPQDPAVQRLGADEKSKFEADVRQLLGEAGFREYQNYERSQPARESVSQLLGNLTAIGAPLTADQMNQLTQIVANHSPAYQQGARVKGTAADVRWNEVVTDAQNLLSPAQLGVLRAAATQFGAIQQMREITDAMMRAAPGQPGAPVKVPKS
ncbi:MAG TPA: sigma-70 family RNA polymerase sigma factor [Opitutaceae bacterium]|nr:sigma-70 family RNA polymerase sigma factor [Opitutaceae bacterium]